MAIFHPASHPILSCTEAKAREADLLKDEAAEWAAMQKAGAAITCALLGDLREIGGWTAQPRLLVLAGKGHNGGDALLAAAQLLAAVPGLQATVVLAHGEPALKPLAARAWQQLKANPRVTLRAWVELRADLSAFDVCLDGIFGFQFRPPIDPAIGEILSWANMHPRLRLRAAVDLPSGVGEQSAQQMFWADFTYATGIVKSPLLAPANVRAVGRIRYLDLGFFNGHDVPESADRVLRLAVLKPLARPRPALSDKRTYGHLFVIGGSRQYPGAILLTVQAALRSGVGLLTAFVPQALALAYAAQFPEAMWVGLPETDDGSIAVAGWKTLHEKLPQASAVVAGPGLGRHPESLRLLVEMLGDSPHSTVIDADAIQLETVAAARGKPVVFTPHAGEFARVAGARDLRGFCHDEKVFTVLKGPVTRACERDTVYHSFFGGPVLARGGSGDMLAGVIGGLLAQDPDKVLLAACRGVVWHGAAADLLAREKGQGPVQASQLLDCFRPALLSAENEA